MSDELSLEPDAARAGEADALGRMLEAYRNYLLLVANQEMDPRLKAKGGASDPVQQTFLEPHHDFEVRGDPGNPGLHGAGAGARSAGRTRGHRGAGRGVAREGPRWPSHAAATAKLQQALARGK